MLIVSNARSIIGTMYYYEVAPTIIVRAEQTTFTYASDLQIAVGTIVEVSVGKRTISGLVIKETTKPSYALKTIDRVVLEQPLPQPLVDTLLWIAEYYHTPLSTVLQTVLPRGVSKKRRTRPAPIASVISRDRTKKVFTSEQAVAIDILARMTPGTALLHGVTGSGKTLIYIELAKQAIAAGTSVIILVPEIALTSQLVAEFEEHFDDIILTHSRQTEAERHAAWQSALESKKPRVVVGPRSALFMPLASIGLVVIDECHEPSFKQEQSPRYSALRLASTLTRHHQAKLILGSATPNVSDYFLAESSQRPIITAELSGETRQCETDRPTD